MTSVIVPYRFPWPHTDERFPFLEFTDVVGGKKVGWGLVGASLFVPDYKWYPSLEEIESNNKNHLELMDFTDFL